jgi:two-component system, NarL family, sensor kinase
MKILTFLLLVSYCSIAQSEAELRNTIKKTNDYKAKAEAYLALGDIVFDRNLDSSKVYYDLANKIYIQNKDNKGQLKYYSYYASVLIYEGKYDEMLVLTKKSLAFAEKINDKEGIARSTANIGNAYNYLTNYKEAIKYYQKSIELFKKNGQPQYERRINLFIALCFHNANLQDKSIEYAKLALKQSIEAKDSSSIAEANMQIGEEYIEKEEELTGEPFALEALKIYKILKVESKIAQLNADLSRIQFKKGDTKEAIRLCEMALKSFRNQGNEFYKINALTFLSNYYLADKQSKVSLDYLEEAKKIAESTNSKAHFPIIYEGLINLYKQNGDFKNALEIFEKYNSLNDSLLSKDLKMQLQDLDIKYQSEKRKSEISQLNNEKQRQNTLIYSLIAGLLAVSIIGFIGYRNIKIRKEIAEKEIIQLQQEKQLTATESILKGQEEERSRLAKDLHDGLGGLLSGIKYTLNTMTGNVILSEQNANVFTRALGQLDNAISEMRRVAHSMMPEALLKFGLNDALRDFCEGITQSGKLKVHFQTYGIDERLNQSVEITIYRIVQELLNNTMKHAQATDAYVQITKAENLLTLTVEDNGKGFNISDLAVNKGAGMSNVESRVAYLNGKMDIQSNEKEGTSINIEIML